jgi:hypothetical protein
MTIEGVGETGSLADALSFLCFPRSFQRAQNFAAAIWKRTLRRLLQSLQNFGQVAPFSTLLVAFASFHSAAHFFWRSRAASCPALGSFFVLVILVGHSCLLLRGGGRNELRHRRNDKSDRERGGKHGFRHGFHFPLFP